MTELTYQTSAVDNSESKLTIVLRRVIAVALAVVVIAALIDFPFAQLPLAIGLCVYAAILYRHPFAWLVVIPALLPVLDFAPWSGRFFFEEFDFLVLTTMAVLLWRTKIGPVVLRTSRLLRIPIAAIALSYLVSLLIGLFPLDPLDANAFANYFSHYNSLRVAKGFVWAVCLLCMVPDDLVLPNAEGTCRRLFSLGMVLGLTAVNIAVLYERFLFAGLLNFSTDLRAIATFSGLHNGGNDIEAYLVFTAPFIVAWVFDRRSPGRYCIGAAVFAFTSYSLLVTFSRGGYLGFLVAWIGVIACSLLLAASRSFARVPLKAPSFAIFLILLGAGIAVPILKGNYIRARFATIALDLQSRIDQLQNTFRMMDTDAVTSLFGMGLGRFPATYLAKQPVRARPTVYTFETEPFGSYLRFKTGSPLYFGQWIRTKPRKSYVLAVDVRSVDRKGALNVAICEKQLQRSFRCQWFQFSSTGVGAWEHFEKGFNIGEVGGDVGQITGRLSRRPVELALYNPGPGNLDVDNVRLLDETGTNLISNGDFSRGQDRWFFTVDELMPWQTSNHWGQIIFEQGWFGLFAFNLLILCVSVGLLIKTRHGDLFSAVALSGMIGVLTVGLFGSLFDTPRMATLIYFGSLFPFRCNAKTLEPAPREDFASSVDHL